MRVTIEKKTDQLNFEDFLGGVTRTVTIAEVRKGNKEQQYDIAIEGDQRVWRPGVTMLKLLVEAWSDDAKLWVGRRVTLFGDPTVKFGPEITGGIRVSHLSDLPGNKTLTVALTETRGRRKKHTVDPLIEAAAPIEPTAEQVAQCTDVEQLRGMWDAAGPERREQIKARVAELTATPETPAVDDSNAPWTDEA